MPAWVSNSTGLSEFSTNKALEHIKFISQKPHYVGSRNHTDVENYLVHELEKLGLHPQIQEGTTLTEWGNFVKSRNIIARIDGDNTSKALLLLSHYDSAPHSFSKGASDDASGLATILEGLRAFLHQNKSHKNDIIVLFSDAEELGLNGAALFVTKHRWAREVGLTINFEARGTSGPSYMLMEVNRGNAALVDGFKKANPKYPVANSLMYSIYKMLPNDTDLTVFREKGKIQGFNFAFIDNHFNYHTQQDSYANVNQSTVAHQGSYLMPLLSYFSNANLQNLESTEDFVYFNIPFCFVTYPFSWILNMAIGAFIFFVLLVFIGLGKKILIGKHIFNGFINLFGTLTATGIFAYFGWKILLLFYPSYNDILQGFTYNGHYYIAAFSSLALAFGFLFYSNSNAVISNLNQTIAPLFIWLLINFGITFYLPGAAFFIIPVWFTLLMLAYFILTQKTSLFLNLLFLLPAIFIFVPLFVQFPIGLGLKMLVGSTALLVLVFGLLLPVFGAFSNKKLWAASFFLIAVAFIGIAHFSSDYSERQTKPNSLIYVLDVNKNQARWATYDNNLDSWTKKLIGENPTESAADISNDLFSKYGSKITFTAKAPVASIAAPTILFVRDSIVGNFRYFKIKIAPNRLVNRYDILANKNMNIYNLKANGAKSIDQKGDLYKRTSSRVLSYYVVDNEPLYLDFCIPKNTVFDMSLLESSFDLLNNPAFKIQPRESWMMPMPFVLNDAVVIQQKIRQSVAITSIPVAVSGTAKTAKDSTTQLVDTLKAK
ncbi:MAG: M20/M25/M40 family metallo-hydrolase [Flavobacterium sp.]|nr:M20/M25/M40 family metallo-hydrolase [Flavobacterium sp.]